MVFSYDQVKEHPKLLLAMTGLSHTEFEQLLRHFPYAGDPYIHNNYSDRDKRHRQYGAGSSASTLVNMEDKLLFMLYAVKVYPLHEMLALEFAMAQSTAKAWMPILREVLKKALDHGGYGPARAPQQLGAVLASAAAAPSGIDGPERPRQRPRDAEKHKHYDSGKNKRTRSRPSCLAASIRATSII